MIYNDTLNTVYECVSLGLNQTTQKVVLAFDSDVAPIAVNDGIMVISIGLKSAEIGSKITTLSENGESVQTDDRECIITVELDFYTSYTVGSGFLNSLCDSIYNLLIVKCTPLDIQKIEVGEIEYRREIEAIKLKSFLTVKKTLEY